MMYVKQMANVRIDVRIDVKEKVRIQVSTLEDICQRKCQNSFLNICHASYHGVDHSKQHNCQPFYKNVHNMGMWIEVQHGWTIPVATNNLGIGLSMESGYQLAHGNSPSPIPSTII